jgi:hypothetical protein
MVAAAVALLGWAASAKGLDRYVSTGGSDAANDCLASAAPCRSVVHAVTQAASGDTINVARGKYLTHVSFDSTLTLTLRGGFSNDFSVRDPARYRTILDGGKTDQIVEIDAQAGDAIALTVDGFTVQKGYFFGGSPTGGGLMNASSNDGASVQLTVVDSRLQKSGGDGGGALRAVQSGTGSLAATFERCLIRRHRTGNGGAVFLASQGTGSAELRMIDSSVFGNRASIGGAIQAVAGDQSTMTIELENSFIVKNKVAHVAALIVEAINSATVDVSLTNVTIERNRPSPLSPDGGVSLKAGGVGAAIAATLRNTILWDNGDPPDLQLVGNVTVQADHNDIDEVENLAAAFVDLGGNVDADPLLGGPSAWPHLEPGSPAIDGGTCTGVPAQDFEGDARPSGGGCDIGADEL